MNTNFLKQASLFLTIMLASVAGLPKHLWADGLGFQISRYEPTTAGEWSILVDHPWFSSTRYFAAGFSLDYAHNSYQFFDRDDTGNPVQRGVALEHQLLGHFDIAGSVADRVTFSLSLPVTMYEAGEGGGGVTPIQSGAVGDPRLGIMVRLFGQPYRGKVSLALGADVWIPFNSIGNNPFGVQVADQGVRVRPKIILSGLASHVIWSFLAAYQYRPDGTIGPDADPTTDRGNYLTSEIQFGFQIGYVDYWKRFSIGPEALFSTMVGNRNFTEVPKPFTTNYSSAELALGIHYNIADSIQLSVAGGVGFLREPGTPDGRFVFRVAYAPIRPQPRKIEEPTPEAPLGTEPPPLADRDNDGIPDAEDLCPQVSQGNTPDPNRKGCPATDKDNDKIPDSIDQCLSIPAGDHPDPNRPGCPMGDRDKDGIIDPEDQCPDVTAGPHPDPNRTGCPIGDKDKDSVLDPDDQCPDVPAGAHPDPNRPGCPREDKDKDGIWDDEDLCPTVPAGQRPDPNQKGCPAKERAPKKPHSQKHEKRRSR